MLTHCLALHGASSYPGAQLYVSLQIRQLVLLVLMGSFRWNVLNSASPEVEAHPLPLSASLVLTRALTPVSPSTSTSNCPATPFLDLRSSAAVAMEAALHLRHQAPQ